MPFACLDIMLGAHHLGHHPGRQPLYALEARLTIIREPQSPAADPQLLALSALGWLLADSPRAERLLALTGMTPDSLRNGLGEPAVLAAVLDFLCSHEPNLVAAAEAVGVDPATLAAARERLGE